MLIAFGTETVLLCYVFVVARQLCLMALRRLRLFRSGEDRRRLNPIHGRASSPVIIATYTGTWIASTLLCLPCHL